MPGTPLVRTLSWLAMLGAFTCALAVFFPAAQLRLGGGVVTAKTTSASFFQLGRSTDSVKAFLADYRESRVKKIGAKALDKLQPRLRGRLGSGAADVQDAMATLDALEDEDVELVGLITAATMWTLLAANLLLIALLLGIHPGSSRWRVGGAIAVSLLTAALALAVYLVLDRVVLEANREIGRPLFSLRPGAYVMPAAAIAAFVLTVAATIAYARARAALGRWAVTGRPA